VLAAEQLMDVVCVKSDRSLPHLNASAHRGRAGAKFGKRCLGVCGFNEVPLPQMASQCSTASGESPSKRLASFESSR